MSIQMYVLIATAYNATQLSNTLSSLAKCDLPSPLEKILIIENGEACGTEDVVENFKRRLPIEYIFCPEIGKSNALNYAITKYVPDDSFILFSDDDIKFNVKWLKNYANYAEKYGDSHYLGSSFKASYEQRPAESLIKYLPPSARGHDDDYYLKKERIKFLGFNYGAFKKDIIKVGMFDPNLGPGSPIGAIGQEFEIQTRLFESGCKPIFIPNNHVWHMVPKEKCSRTWNFKRIVKKGIKRSYIYDTGKLQTVIDASVIICNFVLLAVIIFDRSLFLKYYFNIAYRWGFIKGVWICRGKSVKFRSGD